MITEQKINSFNVAEEVERLLDRPAVECLVRPTSLNLDLHQCSCWCCPICRTVRRRPPTKPARRFSPSGPARCRTDRVQPPAKDCLPPPPPPPLPQSCADTASTNDEYLTEVSVLSEESHFTHDELTLVQSGSFRHFEVGSHSKHTDRSNLFEEKEDYRAVLILISLLHPSALTFALTCRTCLPEENAGQLKRIISSLDPFGTSKLTRNTFMRTRTAR